MLLSEFEKFYRAVFCPESVLAFPSGFRDECHVTSAIGSNRQDVRVSRENFAA